MRLTSPSTSPHSSTTKAIGRRLNCSSVTAGCFTCRTPKTRGDGIGRHTQQGDDRTSYSCERVHRSCDDAGCRVRVRERQSLRHETHRDERHVCEQNDHHHKRQVSAYGACSGTCSSAAPSRRAIGASPIAPLKLRNADAGNTDLDAGKRVGWDANLRAYCAPDPPGLAAPATVRLAGRSACLPFKSSSRPPL